MDLVRSIFAATAESNRGDLPLNSIIRMNESDVMKQAEAAWERIKSGTALSLLDGVPVIIKESLDIAGHPSTQGTNGRIIGRSPAPEDSPLVQRLRKTGAIVLGKSSTFFDCSQPRKRLWR